MTFWENLVVALLSGIGVAILGRGSLSLLQLFQNKRKQKTFEDNYTHRDLRYIALRLEASQHIYQYAVGYLSLEDLDNIKGWIEAISDPLSFSRQDPDLNDLKDTYDFQEISEQYWGYWGLEAQQRLADIDPQWIIDT